MEQIRWACLVLVAIVVFTPSQRLINDHRPRFIVWNVGQGQWTTYSTSQDCIHVDSGGEFFSPPALLSECKNKRNAFWFTHLDRDHISFFTWAQKNLNTSCLAHVPTTELQMRKNAKRLMPLFSSSTPCRNSNSSIELLFEEPRVPFKNSNDRSHVFVISQKILVPGDSTARAEKIWASDRLHGIQILIAGHHGSKTSTSELLIQNLPDLKLAIVSQRKKKYGHPHFETVQKLKRFGIPTLQTEEWGHIILEN